MVSRFPFPLEKGDKLRSYHQIKELAKSHSVHLISLSDSTVHPDHVKELENYCASVTIHQLSRAAILWNTFRALFGKKPLQVGYFFHYGVNKKIQKQLKELQPKHIISQLIRTTEYTKNYHSCPKTLDYMDALSKGIERRIEKARWYSKWLFQLEAKRLQQYERSVFDYYEYKTIISEQDRNYIFHPDRKHIQCVPNGIDSTFFDYQSQQIATFDLVFVGNMSYPPNIDAAKYICSVLLPELSQSKFLIAGASPHPSLQKIAQDSRQVELSGWVEDIKSAYCKGRIFIAPMMIGTGMQNKLLEAMALGIPCITTDLANNAIKAIHEESILVANTREELLSAIQELLNDPDKAQRIGKNGQAFVKENYTWEASTKALIDIVH